MVFFCAQTYRSECEKMRLKTRFFCAVHKLFFNFLKIFFDALYNPLSTNDLRLKKSEKNIVHLLTYKRDRANI